MTRRLTGLIVTASVSALALSASAADAPAIPDFAGFWYHGVDQIVFAPIPGNATSPVIDVLNMECTPDCPRRPPGQAFIGDHTNPNLTPVAAQAVETMANRWRSGEIINVATELCAPSGVPHIVTLFGHVQFLQSDDMVVILYERDHQVRYVKLNQPHSENPAPSWYGESVGHYEGDTLVIDTIGLDSRSLIDRFGVPQTETTRVVERYRVSDDRTSLIAHVTVEDPAMFRQAWSGTVRYSLRPGLEKIEENRCAENNRSIETGGHYPIPIDLTHDF
jgi:hypothetical protein